METLCSFLAVAEFFQMFRFMEENSTTVHGVMILFAWQQNFYIHVYLSSHVLCFFIKTNKKLWSRVWILNLIFKKELFISFYYEI